MFISTVIISGPPVGAQIPGQVYSISHDFHGVDLAEEQLVTPLTFMPVLNPSCYAGYYYSL